VLVMVVFLRTHLQCYSIVIIAVCSSKNKPPQVQGFSFRSGGSFVNVNSLNQVTIVYFF